MTKNKKEAEGNLSFFLCSRGAATAVLQGDLLACGQIQRARAAQRPLKRGAVTVVQRP